ncbi:hypothetical protein TNCT_675141 [Trichonephila clavata]|uniref:Uncharacterized protein n=1 Tax=Trichonephila clavata TaxID=2740835 RepID=A0A8X6G3C5_TRICU|nr:hypothetical protein TNCT_675141 [Trichonephila clavata]
MILVVGIVPVVKEIVSLATFMGLEAETFKACAQDLGLGGEFYPDINSPLNPLQYSNVGSECESNALVIESDNLSCLERQVQAMSGLLTIASEGLSH